MAKDHVTALVKKGITVIRDGKRVRPEINKNFDFTADEVESIKRADAGALAAPVDTSSKGNAESASTTDAESGKPTTSKKAAAAAAAAAAATESTAGKAEAEGGAGDDAGSKTDQGAGSADDDL